MRPRPGATSVMAMTTTSAAQPWRTNTVDGILRRSAARTPGAIALRFEGREWTYRELDDAVTRGAVDLRARGLAAGERVVTYGTNSDAYVIAFLAIVRAGLVHVPVNYALHGAELAYLIAQSGSRAALVDPHLREHFDAVRADTAVEIVEVLRDEDGSFLERAGVG